MTRHSTFKPALAWFSAIALIWTLVLVYAGGFTTTIKAGMVFLDWPLSNGSLNPDGWLENEAMLAEHSHRLLGAKVGLLTLILAVWTFLREGRRWVRHLALFSLGFVILQGLLGGMRVLFDSLTFAMIHGFTGQIFVCLLATLALAQTPPFFRPVQPPRIHPKDATRLRLVGLACLAFLLLQLLLGILVRHLDAGLAIPTFPLTPQHTILPPLWDTPITLHFMHRTLGIILGSALAAWFFVVWKSSPRGALTRPLSLTAAILLVTQILLGISIIWTNRLAEPTTLHVLVGAFLLASTWATFFSFRRETLCGRSTNPSKSHVSTTVTPAGITAS